MIEEDRKTFKLTFKDQRRIINKEITLLDLVVEKQEEIERLNNIIKEAREYIKENQEEHKYTDRGGFTYTEGHFLRDSDTLLEILDKENI